MLRQARDEWSLWTLSGRSPHGYDDLALIPPFTRVRQSETSRQFEAMRRFGTSSESLIFLLFSIWLAPFFGSGGEIEAVSVSRTW